LSNNIDEKLNRLAVNTIIELYIMDATAVGGDIYRFTSSAYADSLISFQGETYTPIQFESSGWESTSDGTLPRPTMTISAISIAVIAAVISLNNFSKVEVTRIKTIKEFLDGESEEDGAQFLPREVYIVNRLISRNRVSVQIELASKIDRTGAKIPRRMAYRDTCTNIYRRYDSTIALDSPDDPFDYENADCPYSGTSYFDINDNEVTSAKSDRCSHTKAGCVLRYGKDSVLPIKAFPGMQRSSS